MRRYKRKSVEVGIFRGVGHFERKFQTEKGVATVGVSKLEWLLFGMVSKYPQCIAWFVTKHVCDGQTEGQTDRQNYDS